MASWSSISEGNKGFASDHEAISHTNDSLSTCRNNGLMMMGWDLKIPSTFETTQGFGELNYPEMLGKQLPDDPIRDKLYGEEESSSKFSSSINSKESSLSLIDLKLGRLGDNREIVHSSKLGKGHLILSSSAESSTPSKRMRVSGLYSQTAYCQVYGCNKDLSSCKEYHKRHKVCEAHSKTSKVIVNGIEQRFCQQCSRFHLLVEFDDGKRSCRKRLAGHNERRRKPQVGLHSGRAGRLLHSYNGSRFQGNLLTTASFICQEILPRGILDPQKYTTSDDWLRRLKLEDGTHYRPLSGMPIANGNLHLKPAAFPGYDVNKQFVPPFHVNNANILSENGSQYSSHSNFHDNTLGGEDLNAFNNTASASAGSALSLLSSHSHSSSSHAHYSLDQVSEKLNIGAGCSQPQASTSGVMSHKKPSFAGMNSAAADDFGVSDGIFERSDHFVNTKDRLSDGNTINLLQLSSQLQRVEEQRQSMQVKQENDAFCLFRIT